MLKIWYENVVLPLLATQIFWINLLTDGAPALVLGRSGRSRRDESSAASALQHS